MAATPRTQERLENGLIGFSVVVPQNRFNCLRRRFQMVMGHVEEDVVSDMGADIVVNVIDKTIVAVNSGECPFEKIPVFAAIPGNI